MADTTPKPFVFVLMPFKAEFDDIYNLGIRAACKEAGAYCERVDQQIFTESILERIYNQIAKADIVVSDMTGQNPNVFYETGYAHALGKRMILLTKQADDIPFDLKHSPHVLYGDSISGLKSELKKRVKYFVDHPDKKQLANPDALEYFVNGTAVVAGASPSIFAIDHLKDLGWNISFDIHNSGNQTLDISGVKFGFVFPAALGIPIYKHETFVRLTNNEYMYKAEMLSSILLPKDYFHVSIQLFNKEVHQINQALGGGARALKEQVHHCSIRTFTDIGVREVEFVLWVK